MARRQNPFVQSAQATLVALCLLSLLLAIVDSRGGFTDALRNGTGTVMGPVQSGVNGVAEPIGAFFADWQSLGSRKQEIQRLNTANDELRARLQLVQDGERRANSVDALLRIAGLGQFKIIAAQVVAIGASQGYANTILIDSGYIDGVRAGMNVVSGAGLIGRVIRVWKGQATVALLTDPTSTVGARVEGSGQIGFVSGLGRLDSLQLQLLDPYAPLAVGDRLVSFGVARGLFATGFPIGTVTAIRGKAGTSTRVATVEPFVSMSSLDIVGVVAARPRTDPRDALLPAVPSATPSATPAPTSDSASQEPAGPAVKATP